MGWAGRFKDTNWYKEQPIIYLDENLGFDIKERRKIKMEHKTKNARKKARRKRAARQPRKRDEHEQKQMGEDQGQPAVPEVVDCDSDRGKRSRRSAASGGGWLS